MAGPTKILLEENDIPTHWYNVVADMPNPPAPPLGPDGQPVPPEALGAIFPGAILEQEMSGERWIAIPEEVREAYRIWRPSPLYRAHRLERMLGTPAKIFYKNEAVSPAGSHKPNTAVPQAFYNKQAGITRLSTETGAGQWGSSLAFAGQMFGVAVRVYMVRVSYDQKPFRRSMMQTWGAEVFASPSNMTNAGRDALAKDPNNQGSLGLAISEAVEEAAGRADTNYALGSVLNHVLLHQTIIGLEAKKQLAKVGEYPDMIFAPCGGGSNFGGVAFPFLADKAAGDPKAKNLRLVAVEKLIEAVAVPQLATFEAGVMFARAEGIIPAPESCHGIRACIDEALRCKQTGEAKTLLFNLSGHGHFDMASYDRYFAGGLEDFDYPSEAVAASLQHLPKVG